MRITFTQNEICIISTGITTGNFTCTKCARRAVKATKPLRKRAQILSTWIVQTGCNGIRALKDTVGEKERKKNNQLYNYHACEEQLRSGIQIVENGKIVRFFLITQLECGWCRYVCCACAIKSQNENFYTFLAFLIPFICCFSLNSPHSHDSLPLPLFPHLFHSLSCSDLHFNAYIRDFISTESFFPIIFTTIYFFLMPRPRRTRAFGFEISSTNMQYNLSFA